VALRRFERNAQAGSAAITQSIQRRPRAFQERALLDVQFNESLVNLPVVSHLEGFTEAAFLRTSSTTRVAIGQPSGTSAERALKAIGFPGSLCRSAWALRCKKQEAPASSGPNPLAAVRDRFETRELRRHHRICRHGNRINVQPVRRRSRRISAVQRAKIFSNGILLMSRPASSQREISHARAFRSVE